MLLCVIFGLGVANPVILDSLLLIVDVEKECVTEVDFGTPIIDYVIDDFLYLSTSDYLYKIEPSETMLIDKTALPMRFNHLSLSDRGLMLISPDEIVIIDRRNLAFKSGIGLEHGDHRPMIKCQSGNGVPRLNDIYLIEDAASKSIIRIIDPGSGSIVKTKSIDRLIYFEYDAKSRSFLGLDVKNNIVRYNLALNRTLRLNLPFKAHECHACSDGFVVYSDQAIFLLDEKGRLIDFQPIPDSMLQENSLLVSKKEISVLDTVVFRINNWSRNPYYITGLLPSDNTNEHLGIDIRYNVCLIKETPLSVVPLTKSKIHLRVASLPVATIDSSWYIQLGAFRDRTNALLSYEKLRRDSVPVIVDSTDLYRIKFGGFTDKFVALDITEQMGLEGWFIYERTIRGTHVEEFHVGTEKYLIRDGIIRKE